MQPALARVGRDLDTSLPQALRQRLGRLVERRQHRVERQPRDERVELGVVEERVRLAGALARLVGDALPVATALARLGVVGGERAGDGVVAAPVDRHAVVHVGEQARPVGDAADLDVLERPVRAQRALERGARRLEVEQVAQLRELRGRGRGRGAAGRRRW